MNTTDSTSVWANVLPCLSIRKVFFFFLIIAFLPIKLFSQKSSTCTDAAKPVAHCKPVTLFLNASGNATLTVAQVNDTSTDDCGLDSIWLRKTAFDCTHLGTNEVYLIVRDSVKNLDSCKAIITVRDTIPPSVATSFAMTFCRNTTIYLDKTGNIDLKVDSINNRATDNCGIISMSLSKTSFNCSNIGINDVVLTAKDASDNASNCTAKVTVRDTIPSSVICPLDIIKSLNTGACETRATFSVTATDNCAMTLKQTMGLPSGSLFSIGASPIVFEAKDASGNVRQCGFYIRVIEHSSSGQMSCNGNQSVALNSSCEQTIRVGDLLVGTDYGCFDNYKLTLFDGSIALADNTLRAQNIGRRIQAKVTDTRVGNSCSGFINVTDNAPPQILKPDDVTVHCAQVPRNGSPLSSLTGEPPVIAECSGTRTTYFDQFYTRTCSEPYTSPPTGFPSDMTFDAFKANNCSKIIVRQFYVRDYYNNESTTKQVIYVKNAAFFDIQCPTGLSINCTGTPINTEPDSVTVNGQTLAGTGMPRYATGESLQGGSCLMQSSWKDTRFDFNDGTYLIRRQWVLYNFCNGKFDTCFQNIFVNEGVPTIACKSNFTANLTVGKTVTVTAEMVLSSVYDLCTPRDKLQFGIRKVGQGSGFPATNGLAFSCSELGTYSVEIWVKDESGRTASCSTTIRIADVNNYCIPPLSIKGKIQMENNNFISANTDLTTFNSTVLSSQFSADFAFGNLQSGQSYRVVPQRPKDWLNGVTTFDIALISRHLLDIEPFNSPYKIIAADADRDGDISAADMLYIRKIILRQLDSIPGNRPWRFVPKQFVFPNPNNPFSTDFPESINYATLTDSIKNADFVAIKTGDVNLSARDNLPPIALAQNNRRVLNFYIDNAIFKKGDIKEITITTDETAAQGFQFTLNYDKRFLNILKIEKGQSNSIEGLDASNYALFKEAGKMTVSWNGEIHGKKTFIIKVEAVENVELKDALKITSDMTPAEAYTFSGETMAVRFNFNTETVTESEALPLRGTKQTEVSDILLFQNEPNPFSNETMIRFMLPEPGVGQMTVFDETGRILKQIKGMFSKGMNNINITADFQLPTGVLMYRLDIFRDFGKSAPFSATKRMVVLRK